MFGLGRHRETVAELHAREDTERLNALAVVTKERDEARALVERLRMDVVAAESVAERYASSARKVVDDILYGAPESWDGDEAAESIAVSYVRALEARCDALRVPRDKWIEDNDGAPWPDAAHNPHGFADLADAHRAYHSGCRCVVLGLGTPEHRPSSLCIPRPGERRCGECDTFGHVHEPVAFTDPWADVQPDGSTTAAVEVYWPGTPEPPRCGKPVRSAPGDPAMICTREQGHGWSPWCGDLPKPFGAPAGAGEAARVAAEDLPTVGQWPGAAQYGGSSKAAATWHAGTPAHPTCIEATGAGDLAAGRRTWACGPECPDPNRPADTGILPNAHRCADCTFATADAGRMDGHLRATGHHHENDPAATADPGSTTTEGNTAP